uniref:Uncharacterized protein n=1 Tax=Leersia perrieri TaxID=77586 RepID=A0A0D9X423_9ORYZ
MKMVITCSQCAASRTGFGVFYRIGWAHPSDYPAKADCTLLIGGWKLGRAWRSNLAQSSTRSSCLWNARVFQQKFRTAETLVADIKEEAALWKLAELFIQSNN